MTACSPLSPFPGLRPFAFEDSPYFRGRDREIDRLADLVASHRFSAVLGSSGAGKSSLVMAGLLPRLLAASNVDGALSWRVAQMRPGSAPIAALAEAIAGLHSGDDDIPGPFDPAIFRDRALGLLWRGSDGLQMVVREFGLRPNERLLLIVDQFEELFRYASEPAPGDRPGSGERDRRDEAAAFVAQLLAPGDEDSPLRVLITMRSDFVGEANRFLGLPEAIDAGQYLMSRMPRMQLELAIREPSALAGASISTALVQQLLNDTGISQDSLPVLQHALMRMWLLAREEGGTGPDSPPPRLTQEHYAAVGTMGRAVTVHADAVLEELGREDPDLPDLAGWLFRALADFDKEGRLVRRPQRLAELVALAGIGRRRKVIRIIERFRQEDCHYLLPSRKHEPSLRADTVIDVAHEALLRNWERLSGGQSRRGWASEEFEDGLIWRSLAMAADAFAADPKSLLAPVPTKRQREWLSRRPSAFWVRRHFRASRGTEAQQRGRYLEEWRQVERLIIASERAAQRERRNRRIVRSAIFVFAAAVFLAGALVGNYHLKLLRQETALLSEQARQLAFGKNLHLTAILGLLPALPDPEKLFQRPLIPDAVGILAEILREQRQHTILTGHDAPVDLLAVSPKGNLLASAATDQGTIQIWPVGTDGPIRTVNLEGEEISSIAFGPDGRHLFAATKNGHIQIVDIKNGKDHQQITINSVKILTIAAHPDGNHIAALTNDGHIRVLALGEAKEMADLPGHGHKNGATITFSPDGQTLASAQDDSIQLYDWKTGRATHLLSGHQEVVYDIAFSPDGQHLASVGRDRTVRLWSTDTGTPEHVLRGHQSNIYTVKFNPNGRSLATAGMDGQIRLWDASSGNLLSTLRGHSWAVFSLAFTPDGKTLFSGAGDRTIRGWNMISGAAGRVLPANEYVTTSAFFLPDGQTFWTAGSNGVVQLRSLDPNVEDKELQGDFAPFTRTAQSRDRLHALSSDTKGTLRLWNLQDMTSRKIARTQHVVTSAIALSPDGNSAASIDSDGNIVLWRTSDDTILRTLKSPDVIVTDLLFSPDGTQLASAAMDGSVRLWDIAKDTPPKILPNGAELVGALAYSPDGRWLAAGSGDKMVRLWDPKDGNPGPVFTDFPQEIAALSFSPDGSRLAVSSVVSVTLVSIKSRAAEMHLSPCDYQVQSLAFSPDGQYLVIPGTTRVCVTYVGNRPEDVIAKARATLPRSPGQ